MEALNFLVYGRKRWFLTRPVDAHYTKTPPLTWLEAPQGFPAFGPQGKRVFECVQQPGEVRRPAGKFGHCLIRVVVEGLLSLW